MWLRMLLWVSSDVFVIIVDVALKRVFVRQHSRAGEELGFSPPMKDQQKHT